MGIVRVFRVKVKGTEDSRASGFRRLRFQAAGFGWDFAGSSLGFFTGRCVQECTPVIATGGDEMRMPASRIAMHAQRHAVIFRTNKMESVTTGTIGLWYPLFETAGGAASVW